MKHVIYFFMLFLVACGDKRGSRHVTNPSQFTDSIGTGDAGVTEQRSSEDFTGTWVSSKNSKMVYTIAKINDKVYTISWKGWKDPSTEDGGWSIPGQIHPGGRETLKRNGDQLEMMGMIVVARVDDNTLFIDCAEERGNCYRR